MKSKLIVVFTFSFLFFLGFVIWQSGSTIQEDKLNFAQSQGRLQISATSQAVEYKLSQLGQGLVTELKVREPSETYFNEQGLLKDFVFIGQYSLDSASFSRKHFSKDNDVSAWMPNYGILALKTFDFKDLRSGSYSFVSLLSPKRESFAMMVYRSLTDEDQVSVGVLKKHTLQSIIDRQKASLTEFYLVNQQGFALAHSTPEYINSMLSEDPLVSKIVSGVDSGGTSVYRNLRGEEVQSVYDRIPKTNLYLISSVELNALTAVGQELQLQLLFVGAGFILIAVGVLILVYRPEKILSVITTENAKVQTVKSMENQKLHLSKDFAKSVVHEFRSSVSNLLSNAKVLSQSGLSSDLKYNVERIETHARKMNQALQKLNEFAGLEKSDPSPAKLSELLQKSLQRLDSKIKAQKIQVQSQISETPSLPWPESHLLNAFESILQNSIEAMNRVAQKNLTVSLGKGQGRWVLSITDSGEGISKANLQKVYDPFFSTRSGSQHSGLGLTRSLGIINECNGDLEITSEEGKGTTVKILLPENGVVAEQGAKKTPDMNLPLPADVEPLIASSLPTPKKSEEIKSKELKIESRMETTMKQQPAPTQQIEGSLDSLNFNLDFLNSSQGIEKKESGSVDVKLSDVPLLTDRTIENMIDENIEFPADPNDPIEIEKAKNDASYLTAPIKKTISIEVPQVPVGQFSKSNPSSKVDKPKPRSNKNSDIDLSGVILPKAGEALPGDSI